MDGEQKIKIRQLYYRDHWPVGTIASNLGLHPETVTKGLRLDKKASPQRASMIKEFEPFIKDVLERYPKLRATRILDMLRDKGYGGSVYPIRRIKRQFTKVYQKAYLDLKFEPGEQAQMDWASFGRMRYGDHWRPLNLFLIVLSYSRRIYGCFFHDMKAARVLEGHQRAFAYFQGSPRSVLVDNMKTAVIENKGAAIRFNEDFLDLAAHYCFIPKACNPRAAWEKGRVEKAVRYIREGFFSARSYTSLADLNEQLEKWLIESSDKRAWQGDLSKSVWEAFQGEHLASCDSPYDPYEQRYVRVDKKAYISFDTNKYPVPPEHVGRKLELRATHGHLQLMWQGEMISSHNRCWGKHQVIRCAGHQEKIAEQRKVASHRHRSALERTLASGKELLKAWNELGESLTQQSKNVLELVDGYGLDEVEAASALSLENGTPLSCSIELILMHKNPVPSLKLKLPKELAAIEIDHRSMSEFDELY